MVMNDRMLPGSGKLSIGILHDRSEAETNRSRLKLRIHSLTISAPPRTAKSSILFGETPVPCNSGKRFHYAYPLPAPPNSPCVLALLSLLSASAASRRTLCASVAPGGCSTPVRFTIDNGRTCCCCCRYCCGGHRSETRTRLIGLGLWTDHGEDGDVGE